jgi:hypothetical protein
MRGDGVKNALLIRNMPPLESIRNARLPQVYQGAKLALVECTKKDECMDWANKAEALASYARQAGDEELRKMADRIQARAIQRCGQLLNEIEKAHGANQNINGGTPTKVTRKSAAEEAGMSKDQAVTAIRVANIPEEEFDEAIESDDPPTVTALAERGKQTRPKPIVDLEGIDPQNYQKATHLLGLLSNFRREIETMDLISALLGVKEFEKANLISDAIVCGQWINNLIERIKK